MKILMISIELPYPPTSGGRMKSWNMIKYLSERHETSLACIIKYGTQDISRFEENIELVHFLHEEATNNVRSAKNLVKSYIAGVPINVYRNSQQALAHKIAAIADQFDVILVDHFESAQFIPADFRGKVAFHAHNATYLMWERFTRSNAAIPYRIATALETRRIKRYERNLCNRADIVFASPNDIDDLVAIGADRSRCRITYHLGDDSQLTLPDMKFDETDKQLLYIGTLNWEANIDGLLWFFEEIWSTVHAADPDITLKIVGKNPDQSLIDAAEDLPNIEFMGFVDDLEPLFNHSRLFIAPLRFGSGIKVKVLNAMCRGIPVITTDVGAEGLEVKTSQHLVIANDAENMSNSILNLMSNKQTWQHLAEHSRQLIRDKYNWNIVLGDMDDALKSLINN
jgi:polysaccharide biosynthesis protein PslH